MKLTQQEISYLSGILTNKSKLSIFSNVKAETIGTEAQSLEEKGILSNGKITKEFEGILKISEEARSCARLIVKDGGFFLEKYTYKGKDADGKEAIILAENDNGEMVFSRLESFPELLASLAELTGMSFLKSADVEILLSSKELMVLMAGIDLYRINALLDYLGQSRKTEFSAEDFAEHLKHLPKNSLVGMLINHYNYTVPEESELSGILGALEQKKVLSKGEKYRLAGQYEAFAANFLIPQTMVMLEAFQETADGNLITTGMLFTASGIKDIGAFLFTGEEVEFSSVSGGYMLKIIENFLHCPDLVSI